MGNVESNDIMKATTPVKDTVLVVDDNQQNLKMISATLYQRGINVILAQNGRDALAAIAQKRPDLVLLDILMPGLDGFAVCRQLKQQAATRDLPVIFLTSRTEPEALLEGFRLGAVDYITKPFHRPELLARVQTHLELQRARALVEEQNRALSDQNQRLERQTREIRELSARNEQLLATQLQERVKELNCLYTVSRLMEDTKRPLDDLFQEVADRLPPGWQYPGITCSRIVYDDCTCVSHNFSVSDWCQQAPITVHERQRGRIEVYYTESRPLCDEGPFLREERSLITAIAEHLGRAVERRQAEHALRQSEHQYRLLARSVADGIGIIQDERLVFVNEALCAIIGQSREQLLTLTPETLFTGISPPPAARPPERSEEASALPSYRTAQTRCTAGDGREVWIEERYSRIDWQGTPALVVTVRDISEQKRRELAVTQEKDRLHSVNIALRASLNERFRLGDIVGKSLAMQRVYESILTAAESDASVVIAGESGTGKELAAWTIHRLSARSAHTFAPVNCGAIPETLFESTFFGHRKGAFTGAHQHHRGIFESTRGGTLFLDEIGELPAVMQVKLLRALAGGGYTPLGSHDVQTANVRIIAATNRDPADMVRSGRMREDFYYRITVLSITLPPLRERKEDVPLLVDHFWKRFTDEAPHLPGSVMKELYDYDWPGNVRELYNALQRYLSTGELDFIAPGSVTRAPARPAAPESGGCLALQEAVEAFERQHLLYALDHHHWHRGNTAATLQIDPKTLYRKMKQYGIH